MKRIKTDRMLLSISVCGFLAMSASFALMPWEAVPLLPGILFWSGLVIGISMQILLETRRRAFFSGYKANRKSIQKPRNGLLSVCSNREATVADVSLVIGSIGTVFAFVMSAGTGVECFYCIALTVFLFCLHCILNGRIYFHAKNQGKIRSMLEKKRNLGEKGEKK